MLNKLPDLAILVVFDHLPIEDIHNTIESYPQFESLFSLALRSRKFLTLIGDAEPNRNRMSPYLDLPLIPKSYSDIYILDHKWMSYPNLLFRTFLRVTTLNINLEQANLESTILKMCQLIDQWSNQLLCLNLSFSFTEQYGNITTLLDSINRLSTLKTLDLDLNKFYLRDKIIDLPLLTRLNQFYFRSQNDVSLIFDSLKNYAQPNTNLRQIGIDLASGNVQKCIDDFSPEFCTRFIHFNVMDNFDGYRLNTFTSRFRSLVTISTFALCDLDPVNCSIAVLAHHLTPLTQLSSLHIKLVLTPLEPIFKQLITPPQLTSVKFIELTIEQDYYHGALQVLSLDHHFPCLESLNLIYENGHCSKCGIGTHSNTQAQLFKCLTKRLQPLRQCSQLAKISAHVRDSREWLNWSWKLSKQNL